MSGRPDARTPAKSAVRPGAPRRLALALIVLTAAFLGDALFAAGAIAPPARAADTDLTLVTSAQYDVQPAQQRVRVSLDVTATNRLRDTVTKRFYFDRAYLAVQPGTRGFAALSPAGAKVAVAQRTKQYTLLRIDFGRRISGGKSLRLKLRFDLPDPGGAATRPIRIGDALVSFPVWAFASDGAKGSTVSVSFPAGYEVSVESGSFPQRVTTAEGVTTLRTGALARPTAFFAYVVADRAGAYRDRTLSVTVGDAAVPFVIRSWVDDPDWARRVRSIFNKGLPIMGNAIGRPWAWDRPVIVAEGASRAEDADAGLFDPSLARIEIAYYADSFVVLHEAAHGWFNGRLLADRWANEAFASYYAERAMTELELKAPVDTLTDELLEARIPLNAWAATAEADALVEDYGYAAALELARRIGARAGDDVLQRVWADAGDHVAAYRAPDAPEDRGSTESSPGPPDWRGLLDLLEEHSPQRFDDLWREWVVRPDEVELLAARSAARDSYRRTLALADGWAIPRAARDALRAWQFETAEAILDDTRTVIAQREALEAAAERSGLELPPRFRELFEIDADLAGASREAIRELEVIDALDAARTTAPVGDDPITSLGLIGAEPDAALEGARLAFAEGRLEDALAGADVASTDWRGAWNEGRRRLLVIVALIATTMVLGSASVGWMRRRRTNGASSIRPASRTT